VRHYGDITKLNGSNLPFVDVVTGGSPCQDLSVAGNRAGLAGERSGLFMEQIRIIKEMRNECIRQLSMRGADEHIRPRYMVWENVVGALSSNGGDDFRVVLEETAKVKDENANVPRPNGKWANAGVILGNGFSIAWRVHDAQYWGVPQRRRRICLLADFDGDTAQKILFELRRETIDTETEQTVIGIGDESRSKVQIECASLHRNLETSGSKREGAATNIKGNADDTSELCYGLGSFGNYKEGFGTLKANGGDIGGGQRNVSDTVGALCAVDYKGAGNQYVRDGKCIIQRI